MFCWAVELDPRCPDDILDRLVQMTTAYSVLEGPTVLSNSNRFLKITTGDVVVPEKLPVEFMS